MARDTGGRYSRRRFVTLAGGGLAWAAACSGPPSAAPAKSAAPAAPGAPAGAPAAAATPAAPAPGSISLQYGSITKTAWIWPEIIALNKGLLTQAGFDVEMNYFRTPANGAQMLAAGALELASINPETVIRSVDNGAQLKMVATDANSAPYSLIVRPEIRSFADFRGKTLPSSGPREQTTVWMKQIMKANGLDESDYDFVTVGGTPERMAAIESGAVAGGLVGQPQDFQMIARGYPRLAVLSEYVPDHPISVHAARTDWLQQHPDQVIAVLRVFRDATRWLYDPTNRAEAISILAHEIDVSEDLAGQTYDMLVVQQKLWSPDVTLTPALVQKSIDFLGSIGDLTPPLPSPDKYLDPQYVQRMNQSA
jgi:ABC-type nitrate/sulfonate/bicarbonate transport system substrate-binding protein